MTKWAGRQPTVDDTFLVRICYAIGESPRTLARSIGVPYSALEPLLSPRYTVAELDMDEVWLLVEGYVSKRIGLLLAIKYEMNKALQEDRKKRVLKRERFKAYHDNR